MAASAFVLVTPDGVRRGLLGEVIKRLEDHHFSLTAMKLEQYSEAQLKEHCSVCCPELVSSLSSGAAVPMVWEGADVIDSAQKILADIESHKPASPESQKGVFVAENVEQVQRQIAFWFNSAASHNSVTSAPVSVCPSAKEHHEPSQTEPQATETVKAENQVCPAKLETDVDVQVCPAKLDAEVKVCSAQPDAEVQPCPAKLEAEVQVCPAKPEAEVQVCPAKPEAEVQVCPAKPEAEVQVCLAKPEAEVQVCPAKPDAEVQVCPPKPEADVQVCPAKPDAEVQVCPIKPDAEVQFCPGKVAEPVTATEADHTHAQPAADTPGGAQANVKVEETDNGQKETTTEVKPVENVEPQQPEVSSQQAEPAAC